MGGKKEGPRAIRASSIPIPTLQNLSGRETNQCRFPHGGSRDTSQEQPSRAPCLTWSFATRPAAKFPSAAACIPPRRRRRACAGWRAGGCFLEGA